MRKKDVRITVTILALAAVGIFAVAMLAGNPQAEGQAVSAGASMQGRTFVLDAGHGGRDGGTSGVGSGVRESDINLKITRILEQALLKEGATVIMTRTDENAIAPSKDADMAKRREIISSSGQCATVSIHQNRYEDAAVRGPQVFYAPGSAEGNKLAEAIQTQMNEQLEVPKPKDAAEGNYYITKSGSAPAVIVECGFLSNPEEDALLNREEYQKKIAKAIRDGLAEYLQMEETVE